MTGEPLITPFSDEHGETSFYIRKLLDRAPSNGSKYSGGHIEIVGTHMGRVAVGIFRQPGRSMHADVLVINDTEITAETLYGEADGSKFPHDPEKFTFTALISDVMSGLYSAGRHRDEDERKRFAEFGYIAYRLSDFGTHYDPYQTAAARQNLQLMIDAGHDFHPAVLEYVSLIPEID